MPIRLSDHPDPLTRATIKGAMSPLNIESEAYRRLVHDFQRYSLGEIGGRSFLIAGHRGAGKTTLVLSAFESVLRRCQGERRQLEPLLVQLIGPNLLPPEEDLPSEPPATDSERPLSAMENVLVQITLGLHRAAVRRFVAAYRELLEQRAQLQRRIEKAQRPYRRRIFSDGSEAPRTRPGGARYEPAELSAQFELELDEHADTARLREYWRRADALTEGVLFTRAQTFSLPSSRPPNVEEEESLFQGSRELVALSSLSAAYRRISGKLQRKDTLSAGFAEKSAVELQLKARGSHWEKPLQSLLAGAAAGGGASALGTSAQLAVLSGSLTALLSMLAGSWSNSRSSERSRTQEDLFVPDLSVATLDRVLPELICRLREAGLAPIFVVDELDKVEQLSFRITEMVRRMKKLVAENACFCFLVDRSYFEDVQLRLTENQYSAESTYFTDQLFVTFRQAELHQYLEKLLQASDNEARDDATALRYTILHNAKMHAIDVRRELAGLRNADGEIALPRGEVRSKTRSVFELLIQVAIELLLQGETLSRELDRRPVFRQAAHDALYYVSRCWERGDDGIRLDAIGESSFNAYLTQRMQGANHAPEPEIELAFDPPNNMRRAAPRAESQRETTYAKREERALLWGCVCSLVEYLADPQKIVAACANPHLPQKFPALISDVVNSAAGRGALLEASPANPTTYHFRFARSGDARPPLAGAKPTTKSALPSPSAPIKPPSAPPSQPVPPVREEPQTRPAPAPPKPAAALVSANSWQADAQTVAEFQRALRAFTDGAVDPSRLSVDLGIMGRSPAWPGVERAIAGLSSGTENYPERESHVSTLRAYCQLLERSRASIEAAFICATLLKRWAPGGLAKHLATVAKILALLELPEDRALELLQGTAKELSALSGVTLPKSSFAAQKPAEATTRSAPESPSAATTQTALGNLAAWMKLFENDKDVRTVAPQIVAEAWREWRDWFVGPSPRMSRASSLICEATNTGPTKLLRIPMERKLIADWSNALVRATAPQPKDDAKPLWSALFILERLGFTQVRTPAMVEVLRALRRSESNNDELNEVFADWPSNPAAAAVRALVLAPVDGATRQWSFTENAVALVLTPVEANERLHLLALLEFEFVVIDLTGTAKPASVRDEPVAVAAVGLRRAVESLGRRARVVAVHPLDTPPRGEFDLVIPMIESSADFFALLGRARDLRPK